MSRKDTKGTEAAEFQKFMRFCCTRFVQAVVHSRMDVPMEQPCVAAPENSDWFNFKQDEFGEVSAYLRTTIKKYPPQVPALTVDFFLHTASGDNLPLESWVLRVVEDEVDENVSIYSNLYHQLGTLLKSLCAAARATPTARHYVKNQSEKTFVLCYRVSDQEPDLELLGNDRKCLRLGNYPSPYGSVQLDLYCRTRMELNLPDINDVQRQINHEDKDGIFVKASIPIHKPSGQKTRLVLSTDVKPRSKNWFNPLCEELPFIADMNRPRNPSSSSAGSEQGIPAIYQNLPAELLAAMPEDIRQGQRVSECDGTPNSVSSVNQKKDFPFSSLANTPDTPGQSPKPKDISLYNDVLSLTSSSSGSKRSDSETTSNSSASSSLRDMVRARQRRHDDLFGFMEDEELELGFPPDHSPSMVPALGYADNEDVGQDLSRFVREMSSPNTISSFELDETKYLVDQLEHFKRKTESLDSFISSMRA